MREKMFRWQHVSLLVFALALLFVGYVVYQWKQPKVINQWVKIYPSGERRTGVTLESEEGRGYEGGPDDQPGLAILKSSEDISLAYIGPTGKTLTINYGGNIPYHYDLDAHYIDGDYQWTTQVSADYVSLNEETEKSHVSTLYHADTHKIEKDVYLNGDYDTPWEGISAELSPNEEGWRMTRYHKGQPTLIAQSITIDEVDRLSDKLATPTQVDYKDYVRTKIKGWQHEMTLLMHLPNLEDASYQKLDEIFFKRTP